MLNTQHFVWTEKYRPKKIQDTILPEELKKTFQSFVDNKNIPNLLLSGSAGIGKTTVALAMLDELQCDYLIINGSDEGKQIDTLRTTISNFASSVSFAEGRKYVILDEADHLGNTVQPALRHAFEKYAKNCGFILTCNFPKKIIEPLHSRCSVINFKISPAEKAKMAALFFKRVCEILEAENIKYNKKVVAELVQKYFPDWRRCLNELQRYSSNGIIDIGILSVDTDKNFKDLIEYMKTSNFTEMRKWVGSNSDIESSVLFRYFYDNASKIVEKQSIPTLIVTLAEYQYKHSMVADPEINIAAALTEIMFECKWVS